jgi:hypothetical protein
MVQVADDRYCGQCKYMAVKCRPVFPMPQIAGFDNTVSEDATEALKYAVIGIFCLGIILAPIAISKALEARRKIRNNPGMQGEGKANAALIISFMVLVLWVFNAIGKLSEMG